MSPAPQLAPPGSSTYNSDTMHVGDGTWDAGRDDFLLPNLVGLNFATMRYNGMGNRFFTMAGYHGLVEAHGIIAAITFLLVIPAAIFLMRFYGRNPRQAVRFHIWLQILALLLVTVVFVIGWFQVGPKRSLTNPHHGIGLALFVLIWVQVIAGAIVHRSERRNRHLHVTLKAMLHHWLGRAIALLGIVQVALGLTLYGSPLFLFVLYTLWTFFLLALYFFLEWSYERRKAQYDTGQSQYTEEVVEQKPGGGTGLGKLAAAGAAGAGLAALWRRASGRRNHPATSQVTGTGSMASSYYYDDKFSDRSHKGGLGKRILEIGAIGGGIAAAKRIFGRKQVRDDDSVDGPYRPPLGGNQSVITDDQSPVEVGEHLPRPVTPGAGVAAAGGALAGAAAGAASRPSHPLAQPPLTPGSRHSTEDYSYYDYESNSPSRRGQHHTFRDAVAAGGAMFAVRQLFKSRKQRKEEQRAEELRNQRLEQERIARMNSQRRYTGDGAAPLRRPRHNRMDSQTASDLSNPIVGSIHPTGLSSSTVPIAGAGAGAAAIGALADRDRVRPVGTDPLISHPGPATAMTSELPPAPPPHGGDLHSSGSELYTTESGRQRHRHHLRDEAAAAVAGGALGAAAATASRRRASNQNVESVESPPVSIHVKTQDNGRKVTLRRLTEEEAAAQRAANRQERRESQRRRNSSFSSSSGGEALGTTAAADRRWRRTEALEAEQQGRLNAGQTLPAAVLDYPTPPLPGTQHGVDPQSGQAYHVPPPPPIPASTSNLGPAGSITSPGTETSGATEYANNRKRRRAERAQARLAREGRTGGGTTNTVDFT